jgi:hypothetical protein
MPPSSPPVVVIHVPGANVFFIGCRRARIARIHYVEAEEKMLALDPGAENAYVTVPDSALMGFGLCFRFRPRCEDTAITRSAGRIQGPPAQASSSPPPF